MMTVNDPELQETPKPPAGSGCLPKALFGLALLWVLGSTALAQLFGWTIEQAIFEGSFNIPDLRWLVILSYGLALLIPFLLALAFTHSRRSRAVLRSWTAASIFVLLFFPLRFLDITAFQLTAAIQIAMMTVFLLAGLIWAKGRAAFLPGPPREGLPLAVVLGGVFLYPWAWIGALGSPLDSLLALLVGLLFGMSAMMVLYFGLFQAVRERAGSARLSDLLVEGLAAALAILMMVTGLGQNGIQWVLALAVPVLGWAAVPIFALFFHERRGGGWLALALIIGLGLAWPLMWVDPDELALVVTVGNGELIGWALRAALAQLALGAAASIALLFAARREAAPGRGSLLSGILALMIGVGAIAVYIGVGRPGFYGERLFVVLKEQADVSAAGSIEDVVEKRAYVYQTLVEHAERSQKDLRQSLGRLGISYRPYYLVNGLEVNGGPLVRWWLSGRPEVDRILDNPMLRPLPAAVPPSVGHEPLPEGILWNQSLIGVDKVWQMGITGKGIVVGQSDSGVQGDHPEVADSYRGRDGQTDYNWFDPWYHSLQPVDISGHGTHTLGLILGNRVGMAPDATWIGCVNLVRNLGNPAYYLDCMQFMLAPFPQGGDPFHDGNPALGANVLNNSWGCPPVEGCDPGTFLPAVAALRAAGIFVVVSAGNAGYSGCGSVNDPPAIYQQVYSVGAVDRFGQLAAFSSLGPVMVDGSNRIKPDIVAPGDEVLSSYPGSSYQTASGTSMAGPHVAGVVALVWSANPELIGNIERTEAILNETAAPYSGILPACVTSNSKPNNASGYGIVDAFAAVRKALDEAPAH